MLVAILTPERDSTEDLLSGMYKASVINVLSILLTAVIQTLQTQLDLYHAIVVMNILFFFDLVFLFGMYYLHPFKHQSPELTRKRVGQRKFIWSSQTDFQMLLYLLMHGFGEIVAFIWVFYVGIVGTKFGSQPTCNHLVTFALFFAEIRVTKAWFKVLLCTLALPFNFLLICFLILAPAERKRKCTDALDNLFETYSWLRWIRYVIGIP
jgi:hypothetical protein